MKSFLKAGYVPQPKQLRVHAAARAADVSGAPSRIGTGGTRGQAKTHGLFAQVALDDLSRREGLKALYLRKILVKAQESFEDLRLKVLKHTPHEFVRGTLKLPNKSYMILGGFKNESDVDAYLGLEYDVIFIDDAPTLSHGKYRHIQGSLRTGRTDWRTRLYASGNPGGIGHHWFVDEFINDKNDRAMFVHTTLGDNKFIDPGYEKYLLSLPGFLGRCWRDGDFTAAAGQYFTAFDPDVHIVKPRKIPDNWTLFGALDYGWKHPTVVYFGAIDNDGNLYVFFEHFAAQTEVSVHAKMIKQGLAAFGFSMRDLSGFVAGSDTFAEARKDGGTIARDYREEGIALTMAKTTRILGARELLKRLGNPEMDFEPSIYIFETCERLIWTLPKIVHDPKKREDTLKFDADDAGDFGDDPYDSLRYLLLEVSPDGGWARGASS